MVNKNTQVRLARFNAIMCQIEDLADEALSLVPEGVMRNRAESYWRNQIVGCVGQDGVKATMTSMQDTYNEMEEE